MASLIERIKNVFTDQMYEPDVARKWVNAAVEDARTYMAQGLIVGFEPASREELSALAVNLGANREKLENGLAAIAAFDRDTESSRNLNEMLPELIGLTPDQATLLCCIRNAQATGGDITGERLYCEMRAAGIGKRGDMDGLYSHLKELQDKGLITTAVNPYGVRVSITEDGLSVASNDVSARKQELLADLSDQKAELREEFDCVRSWTDDNGKVVTLSPEGFAEYLEAICLVDQMELAVTNSVPLQLTGKIPEDSAANQVLNDFREQLAQVGSKVERVVEQKESVKQDQSQGMEPIMAMRTGMRMTA